MMARFNKERDDATDTATIQSCTNSTTDFYCLFDQDVLGECEASHDPNKDHTGLVNCLESLCPNTSGAVIDCVADPTRSISDDNQEAIILDSCSGDTLDGQVSSDGNTCLRLNFDTCAFSNDPGFKPDRDGFNSCMHSACPDVNGGTINCLSIHFQEFFSDCQSGTCE
jgi:hypothetical protein